MPICCGLLSLALWVVGLTLIQAFLKSKFPEPQPEEPEESSEEQYDEVIDLDKEGNGFYLSAEVKEAELEITETDSKGNTILLYGKDEDGRPINRLSLDMAKKLEVLKDSPVGTEIEGMLAVTVKVDGEVFLATDKDGTVLENKQTLGANVEKNNLKISNPDLTVSENVNGDEVLLKGENPAGQSVDQLSDDFKNQLTFLMSTPVGTDLPIGAITIKSGNQVLFETDNEGKVVINQMFPDDRDKIEDFELDEEVELSARVEAEFRQEAELDAEIEAELQQEWLEQSQEDYESLSWIDEMFDEEELESKQEPSQEEPVSATVNQQIQEVLDELEEAITESQDETEQEEQTGEQRLDFEALVDLFSLNLEEMVAMERDTATYAMDTESQEEDDIDLLGAFFEGFSSEKRAEIEAEASLQMENASVAASESVSDSSLEASSSVDAPTVQDVESQSYSTLESASTEGIAWTPGFEPNPISRVLHEGAVRATAEDTDREASQKPIDGLNAAKASVNALPSSPTKDAMLGMVVDMQASLQQQEKNPDLEMEAFALRRKLEPQNQQWWQKVSSTLFASLGNVRDRYTQWRAATTLNKLAQSQALQSGESYEAADYTLSRQGDRYTLSDKEGNTKMRFESTILGVKVDKTLPPVSAGDFAKTQQLRADLEAGKEPSGAFTQQAVHEGRYVSRVNQIIKALSTYAASQGGNAKVEGKLSYDFRSNSKGSVIITDKQGNVLLAAGNGHMRSRMEEKDLAHFEKMIPALQGNPVQANTKAQVTVSAAPAATKKSKGLELG